MPNLEWSAAQRRYTKASGALVGAIAALENSALALGDDFDDYADGHVTFNAIRLLKDAADRLNKEHTATRKRLGVAVYQPYGRRFARRW